MPKLIIIGAGETAMMSYEYFTKDSTYEVAAFAVDSEFLNESTIYGCPVHPLEAAFKLYPPEDFDCFVALSGAKLNRPRTEKYLVAKQMGYKLVSYISTNSHIWHSAEIGENCFILEGSVIQHGATIGNNVFIWSGSQILHRTCIDDNCFVSSNVTVCGFARIGASCYLGATSTVRDDVIVCKDNFLGAGSLVISNTEEGALLKGVPAKKDSISTYEYFKLS